jgi:hypothetical protein
VCGWLAGWLAGYSSYILSRSSSDCFIVSTSQSVFFFCAPPPLKLKENMWISQIESCSVAKFVWSAEVALC